MIYIYFMDLSRIPFPPDNIFPDNLIPDQTGLVALGGSLSIPTLIEAYSKGIFPWAGTNPIPWYSPDPRLVLVPEEFKISRRFGRELKNKQFQIYYDRNFERVITNCARIKRKHQNSTWIDQNIITAYTKLFNLHIAHCIEVYRDEEPWGGLYGLSLGKIFFGESMFSLKANGSKIALYYLVKKLITINIHLIDCQQSTPHMISLGAKEISRKKFLQIIKSSMQEGICIAKW